MKISLEKYNELQNELEYLDEVVYKRVLEEEQAAGGPMESFHQAASATEERSRWKSRRDEIQRILSEAIVYRREGFISKDIVEIGDMIDLEDEEKKCVSYMIVDPIEADPIKGKVSYVSPLGQSLLDQKLGSVVTYKVFEGSEKIYKIVKIY